MLIAYRLLFPAHLSSLVSFLKAILIVFSSLVGGAMASPLRGFDVRRGT